MSTVWVTQETDHDIRQAERWGEIKFVSGRDFMSIKDSQVNEDILHRIKKCADEYNQHEDWILITGSPYLAVAFIGNICRDGDRGALRFLRWSNRDGVYYPLELNI